LLKLDPLELEHVSLIFYYGINILIPTDSIPAKPFNDIYNSFFLFLFSFFFFSTLSARVWNFLTSFVRASDSQTAIYFCKFYLSEDQTWNLHKWVPMIINHTSHETNGSYSFISNMWKTQWNMHAMVKLSWILPKSFYCILSIKKLFNVTLYTHLILAEMLYVF
jgi:hypothetical protein